MSRSDLDRPRRWRFCGRQTRQMLEARARNDRVAVLARWQRVNDPVAQQLICWLLTDLIINAASTDHILNTRHHRLVDPPTWRAVRPIIGALLDAHANITRGVAGGTGWAETWPQVRHRPEVIWVLTGIAFEAWIPSGDAGAGRTRARSRRRIRR